MLWFSFLFKETQSEIKSVCKLTVSFCAPTFLLVLLSAQKLSMGLCNDATQSAGKNSLLFILSEAGSMSAPCSLSGSAQVACELVLTGTHMCTHVSSCSQAHACAHRRTWWSPSSHSPQLCTEHSGHPQTLRCTRTQSVAARKRQASPSAVVACMVCMVACKQIDGSCLLQSLTNRLKVSWEVTEYYISAICGKKLKKYFLIYTTCINLCSTLTLF